MSFPRRQRTDSKSVRPGSLRLGMTVLRLLVGAAAACALCTPQLAAASRGADVQAQLAQRHAEQHAFFDARAARPSRTPGRPACRDLRAPGPSRHRRHRPPDRDAALARAPRRIPLAPRGARPARRAGWLRSNLDVVGLGASDLRDCASRASTGRSTDHPPDLAAAVRGIPAFDSAFASTSPVTAGSSRPGLAATGLRAGPHDRPRFTPGGALPRRPATHRPGSCRSRPAPLDSGARRHTRFAGAHQAKLILSTPAGASPSLARSFQVAGSTAIYDLIVGDADGALLRRSNE